MLLFQNLKTGEVLKAKTLSEALAIASHWGDLKQDFDVFLFT